MTVDAVTASDEIHRGTSSISNSKYLQMLAASNTMPPKTDSGSRCRTIRMEVAETKETANSSRGQNKG